MVTRRDERIARLASGSGHGGRLKTGDDAPQFVETIKVDLIDPDPDQPRRDFNQAELKEMAESLRSRGQLQPIVLIKAGDRFTISMGERRWRASKLAGLPTIRALVRSTPFEARDALVNQIVENEQRSGLTASELILAVARLSSFGMSGKEIAVALAKPANRVSELLKLAEAPPELRAIVDTIGSRNAYGLLLKWRDHPDESRDLVTSIQTELITRPLIETIGSRTEAAIPARQGEGDHGASSISSAGKGGEGGRDLPAVGASERPRKPTAKDEPADLPTVGRMIVDHSTLGHGHVVFGGAAAPGKLTVLFDEHAAPVQVALAELRAIQTFTV